MEGVRHIEEGKKEGWHQLKVGDEEGVVEMRANRIGKLSRSGRREAGRQAG